MKKTLWETIGRLKNHDGEQFGWDLEDFEGDIGTVINNLMGIDKALEEKGYLQARLEFDSIDYEGIQGMILKAEREETDEEEAARESRERKKPIRRLKIKLKPKKKLTLRSETIEVLPDNELYQ